jgi:hypothetical protein
MATTRASLFLALFMTAPPLAAQGTSPVPGHLADSSLAFLALLVGRWLPVLPDSTVRQIGFQPVAGDYRWVVGRKAIHLREDYRLGGSPDSARLLGMIYRESRERAR